MLPTDEGSRDRKGTDWLSTRTSGSGSGSGGVVNWIRIVLLLSRRLLLLLRLRSHFFKMMLSSWIQVYTVGTSPLNDPHHTHRHLPQTPRRRIGRAVAQASSDNGVQNSSSSSASAQGNPLSVVLDVPKAIWRQTLRPLSDFGLGGRSIWEGGVGLFIVSGAVILALSIVWLRGMRQSSRFRKYQAVFEFPQACGVSLGTPLRIRGVNVGAVVGVNSSLKSVDAVAEVDDDKIIIPRNSLVEVNQSGLLMETYIDINPQDPLPTPSAGPLDVDCVKEGLIVCDREKIKGQEGVSLDALVGIFTRLGREVEEVGIARSYSLAEKVAAAVLEAQPLLAKIEAMSEDIQPLLSDVCASALLEDIKSLTKSLAEASKDLRKAQTSVLTPDSANMLRESVSTLIFTLKNIESITSDVSDFTGDEATRRNMKLLIKSLSRLL